MFHYNKKYNTGISPVYLPRSDLLSVIKITVSWDLNRRQLWASEQEERKNWRSQFDFIPFEFS